MTPPCYVLGCVALCFDGQLRHRQVWGPVVAYVCVWRAIAGRTLVVRACRVCLCVRLLSGCVTSTIEWWCGCVTGRWARDSVVFGGSVCACVVRVRVCVVSWPRC